MTAVIFIVLPLLLLLLATPIFVVLLAATTFGLLHLEVGPLRAVHSAMFGGLDSFRCWQSRFSSSPVTCWRAEASRSA